MSSKKDTTGTPQQSDQQRTPLAQYTDAELIAEIEQRGYEVVNWNDGFEWHDEPLEWGDVEIKWDTPVIDWDTPNLDW